MKIIIAITVMFVGTFAFADAPRSPQAVAAAKSRDKSIVAAEDAFKRAKAAAERRYVAELKAARTSAERADDKAEVAAIDAAIADAQSEIEQGDHPSSPQAHVTRFQDDGRRITKGMAFAEAVSIAKKSWSEQSPKFVEDRADGSKVYTVIVLMTDDVGDGSKITAKKEYSLVIKDGKVIDFTARAAPD